MRQLLNWVFEDLTDYFVDNCPEHINWENFNPGIDAARDRIADCLELIDKI